MINQRMQGGVSNSELMIAYVSSSLRWVKHYEDFESSSLVLNYLHFSLAFPPLSSSFFFFSSPLCPSPKKAISLSKEELINQINQSVLLRNYKAQMQHQLFR